MGGHGWLGKRTGCVGGWVRVLGAQVGEEAVGQGGW